jgi:hypothetical protein
MARPARFNSLRMAQIPDTIINRIPSGPYFLL